MVARYSPSFAKNIIGRSLRGVMDPHPTQREINRLWQHFDAKCAFCGCEVGIREKDAHLDHLESGDGGGANHISNRVLACAKCNEKEKRELPWRQFLKAKATPLEFEERERRILQWQTSMYDVNRRIDEAVLRQVDDEILRAITAYESAVATIRQLRDF